MKPALVMLSFLSVLFAACATTRQPLSPELRSALRERAHMCMREHPEIERYEVDRFGTVTAYYRMSGRASMTDPFFECVRK